MSARELHRYVRNAGKSTLTFRDIKPFVDKNQSSLIIPARVLAHMIAKKRKDGEAIPDKHLIYAGLLNESGILIHPLNLNVCLELETNPLKIRGVPFRVYFHQISGNEHIGGTFLNTTEPGLSSVFLSLSIAIHLISNYISANNLQAVNVNQIGRNFLMQRHKDGSIASLPKEKVMEMVHHFTGSKLMELEINRLFSTCSASDYLNMVEIALNNIAMHEGAHVLHKDAGIIGRGGMDKEEVRAYLTEMAYGNPAFSFAYLPSKKINDPNCIAGRSIIEQIYNATDLASLLNASNKQLRALAVELLDREFLDCFGAHHDQIIPKLEIYRIKNHKFFNDEKLPMIESLRYLPKKKAA